MLERPSHLPTPDEIAALPRDPLRVLVSGCLTGLACGWDGTNYGEYPMAAKLLACANVERVVFCPEHHSFGTPRELCNIVGGDGHAVHAGNVRVLTEDGNDWTDGMIAAARAMLQLADERRVHLALMMDISAACGSTVIYDGSRSLKNYRRGPGVAAALLIEHGYRIVSQRDFRTLHRLLCHLDPAHAIDEAALDHWEAQWYQGYFGKAGS